MESSLTQEDPATSTPKPGLSLCERWGRLRVWLLVNVVLRKWFDAVILCVIFANCVLLALDRPLDDPGSNIQQVIQVADQVGTST